MLTPINGTSLYVAPPAGEGELLVLVHGSWTDHATWEAVVAPLSRRFRVIRYDRRGHSRSPYGPGPSPRSRDEDDLAALIASLGEPAHLVASSYGASIALGLAARRPWLVRSVVAHEPPLLGTVPQPAIEAAVASVWAQLASGDVAGGTRRFFEEVALGPGAWGLLPEPLRGAAIANAQTFLDMRETPGWDRLDAGGVARVAGRVVISAGTVSPPWLPEVARGVATRIGCELRVIDGAGHAPHMTTPAALVALVEDVLDGALSFS